jgi:phosphoribosylamine--glycine ligase
LILGLATLKRGLKSWSENEVKVLLVGGGGREHALGWKIAESPLLTKLYLANGAPALNQFGEITGAAPDNIDAVVAAAKSCRADLVVVGPEAPLAAGLADRLVEAGIPCFGPSAAAARLETSKSFMKEIAAAAHVPTARWRRFDASGPTKSFLDEIGPPYVVKADGLAAGKGVVITQTRPEAEAAIDAMLGGLFGEASRTIVIEEFLAGEEASFFAISDGKRALPLIAVQDHKRAFDGDEGPNTGGMGAYAPAPVFTDAIRKRTIETVIDPVIAEMAARGTPFVGVLFAGLMIGQDGPKLIEFNARFGDPECQVLMRLMRTDILPILLAAAKGRLEDASIEWRNEACALVVMAAKGYPGDYQKGSVIRGVDEADRLPGVKVFEAGVTLNNGERIANGGRVLNVSAIGATIEEAVARAYRGVAAIDWPQGFYRRDIAWRALKAAP